MDDSTSGARKAKLARRLLPRWIGVERDVDSEIRHHIDARAAELMRSGVPRTDALAQAQREFGDVDAARTELVEIDRRRSRADRRAVWWGDLSADLRSAMRSLRRAPGFVFVAVVSLAIGIAANTTVFSVIEAVVFRPLPYARDHELLALNTRFLPESGVDIPEMAASWPELADYGARSRELSSLGSFVWMTVTLGASGAPERVDAAGISWNLFDVLGVRPAIGRNFVKESDDPGAACTVIIGDRLWHNQFGADASVVDRVIELEGQSCRVAGVMPASFMFPNESVQLWQSLAQVPTALRNERQSHSLFGVARLASGATLESARVEAALIANEWEARFPDHHQGHFATLRTLKEAFIGSEEETLTVLWIAVALVLVIVCVNLSNLELNRVEGKRLELAVRSALGAGRWRLVRLLLVETVVLVTAGWLLGLLVSVWGVRAFVLAYPSELPRAATVGLNTTVLVFSAVIAALSMLAIGLVPALRFARGTQASDLRADIRTAGAGTSSRNMRSALVTIQVALAVGMVVPALLLVRSYRALTQIDIGIVTTRTLTASITLPADPYSDAARAAGFYDALAARLGEPGIAAAGAMAFLPIHAGSGGDMFEIEGRPAPMRGDDQTVALYVVVTPNAFRALGIPVRNGRVIEPSDRAGSLPVAVVNEAALGRYWPNENPVGRRIRFFAPDSGWITIVGVVADVRGADVTAPAPPAIYTGAAQNLRPRYSAREMALAVRATTDFVSAQQRIVRAVSEVDARVPVTGIRPLVELTRENVGSTRIAAQFLGSFALSATLLALIGVYGVLSYIVRQRAREIGVRIALGATPRHIVGGVFASGLMPIVVGAALGAAGAVAVSRAVETLLFSVGVVDPLTYAMVALALVVTGIVASVVPALRAARIDPQEALRAG